MILSDDGNYGVKELTNLVQFVFDAAVLELESGDVVHRVWRHHDVRRHQAAGLVLADVVDGLAGPEVGRGEDDGDVAGKSKKICVTVASETRS